MHILCIISKSLKFRHPIFNEIPTPKMPTKNMTMMMIMTMTPMTMMIMMLMMMMMMMYDDDDDDDDVGCMMYDV